MTRECVTRKKERTALEEADEAGERAVGVSRLHGGDVSGGEGRRKDRVQETV